MYTDILGYNTVTFIRPEIIGLIILSCFLITILNIRYSIILMIFLSIIIPLGQKIGIFGLNFNIFRILILAGWVKIIFNGKLRLPKLEKIDKAMIYWVVVSCIVFMIQQNNVDAFINRLGFAYNAIGVYFLYRILIKRTEDVNIIFYTFAIVSAVVAVCMLNEYWTGKNFFYIFGGVHKYSSVRMGKIRSQGPFAHAINAGVFGATMLPLYFSMWRHKWGNVVIGIIGTLSACVMVFTSTSATPLIAAVLGFAALWFWPLRNNMRTVRYGILFVTVIVQIIISSPIWNYIKKAEVVKGAAVLHRFQLVDNLINRFTEWFFIGYPSTVSWGSGMADKANQYYKEATTGGILRLALFIIIIVFCFNIIGRTIKTIKDIPSQKKLWAIGCALFTNLVAFWGVSYWDQMLFIWYLFLALITSTCLHHLEKEVIVPVVSNTSSLDHATTKNNAIRDQVLNGGNFI